VSRIGYGYGSEWHLLRWLGYHRAELGHRVAEAIGADDLDWLDLATGADATDPFEMDLEWVNVDFIPDVAHPARVAWRETWPRAWGRVGPHWDAVGVATAAGAREWIFVEAKANAAEVTTNASTTMAPASRHKIEAAFAAAAPSFGVTDTSSWFRGGYQLANRLCALDVLNRNGAPARLVLIYFCGDDSGRYRQGRDPLGRPSVYCPKDEADWRVRALDAIHARMGWRPGQGPLGDRVHELFLPVASEDGDRAAV